MADVATLPGHTDEVEENGADDYDGLGARSSENDDAEAELVAFCDLLTESFHDVDVEYTGFISSQVGQLFLVVSAKAHRRANAKIFTRNAQSLGTIMDSLVEEELLQNYNREDLEMLAADMDTDGTYVLECTTCSKIRSHALSGMKTQDEFSIVLTSASLYA